MMRKNGLGTVYQRGQSWVIDYYINGKRIRETVRTARSESQSRAKLKERISQIHTNTFIRYEEKLGFEGLVKMIRFETCTDPFRERTTRFFRFKRAAESGCDVPENCWQHPARNVQRFHES